MRIIVFSETTDRTATPGASTSPRAATAASAKTSETTTATHNNRATSSSVYAVDGTIFFSLYTRNSYSGIHLRPDLPRNESLPGSPAAPIYTKVFFPQRGHAFGRYFKYAINAEKPIIPIIPTTNIHIKSSSDEEEERLPVMPARS